MFLDGQKLHSYIPMAKARGFTGAVDKIVKYNHIIFPVENNNGLSSVVATYSIVE